MMKGVHAHIITSVIIFILILSYLPLFITILSFLITYRANDEGNPGPFRRIPEGQEGHPGRGGKP